MNGARLHDGAIKSAQTPAFRGRVSGLRFRIVNCFLDSVAVDVERFTGTPDLGHLKNYFPHAIPLSYTHLTAIQTLRGEVLSQGSGIQRIAGGLQFLKPLSGDNEDRLPRSAVNCRVGVCVARHAFLRDISFMDG